MITIKHKFLASVVIEGQILPNSWDMNLNLIPNESIHNHHDIAIATDRVNVWIESMLDNSMLVGPQDMLTLKEMSMHPFAIGVHPLPDEPYDRILSICLYTKISSIMENKMFVDSIWLESYQREGISHTYCSDDGDTALLKNLAVPGQEEFAEYWYRKDPVFFRVDNEGVTLTEQSWKDLGLSFDAANTSDGKVVPITKSKFKPRIIPGDKGDDSIA